MIKAVVDLEVFNLSYNFAMEIFKVSRNFPKAETYSLTDQIVRSSRSILQTLLKDLEEEFMKASLRNIWFMQWDH